MNDQENEQTLQKQSFDYRNELEAHNERFAKYDHDLAKLWALRHELFNVIGKDGAPLHHEGDALYDDPSYNPEIINEAVGLRAGGTIEYGKETEKYDDTDDAVLTEKNRTYRKAILAFGQKYGFVAETPGKSSEEFDRKYGLAQSDFQPIDEPVEAVIITGAAGKSNVVRAAGALREILKGHLDTDKIVLAGCDRPSNPNEMAAVEPFGTRAGATEIDSMMIALQDIARQDPRCLVLEPFTPEGETREVPYGKDLFATSWKAKLLLGGREVEVVAVSAPYDPERVAANGGLERANTEETFLASKAALSNEATNVVIASHDTWGPNQEELARLTLGVHEQKHVHLLNTKYDDRVLVDDEGNEDIRAAEQLIGEFAKTHATMERTRRELAERAQV